MCSDYPQAIGIWAFTGMFLGLADDAQMSIRNLDRYEDYPTRIKWQFGGLKARKCGFPHKKQRINLPERPLRTSCVSKRKLCTRKKKLNLNTVSQRNKQVLVACNNKYKYAYHTIMIRVNLRCASNRFRYPVTKHLVSLPLNWQPPNVKISS